jgi:hypothetical protein
LDGLIAVYRRTSSGHPSGVRAPFVGPVYSTRGGPLAVPTGLLFVRFAEGTAAASQRESLERAGFDLVEVPSFAPHAAWIRPSAGGIGAALRRLADVEAIPGVENVEPQMLTARVPRQAH